MLTFSIMKINDLLFCQINVFYTIARTDITFVFIPLEFVKHSSCVLISRQHLIPLTVFSPCRHELHVLDGVPQTAADMQEVGNTYVHSCTLFPSTSQAVSVRSEQALHSQWDCVCRLILASRKQGGSRLKSACQALEENTTQSFNSVHEKQPRSLVKMQFDCASNLLLFIDPQYGMTVPEEISSVENSTGIVVGQLKAICTWHYFVDIITFLLGSVCNSSEVLKCKSTGERVIIPHKISPVFKLVCLRSQLWKLVHQKTKYTRNKHFVVIQLGDSKGKACRFIYRACFRLALLYFQLSGCIRHCGA